MFVRAQYASHVVAKDNIRLELRMPFVVVINDDPTLMPQDAREVWVPHTMCIITPQEA